MASETNPNADTPNFPGNPQHLRASGSSRDIPACRLSRDDASRCRKRGDRNREIRDSPPIYRYASRQRTGRRVRAGTSRGIGAISSSNSIRSIFRLFRSRRWVPRPSRQIVHGSVRLFSLFRRRNRNNGRKQERSLDNAHRIGKGTQALIAVEPSCFS